FTCADCGAKYMIADDKIGPRGVKVRCKKCANVIVLRPQKGGARAGGSAAPEESAEDKANGKSARRRSSSEARPRSGLPPPPPPPDVGEGFDEDDATLAFDRGKGKSSPVVVRDVDAPKA